MKCLLLLAFVLVLFSHGLSASAHDAQEADSFVSSFYEKVRINRQRFENPNAFRHDWARVLSPVEMQRLMGASVHNSRDAETFGLVLGRILERKIDAGEPISAELMQTLVDFTALSGFWNPDFEAVFQGSAQTITKLAALKDSLLAGRAANYFYFLDSVCSSGFILQAKSLGVVGPSFSEPFDVIWNKINLYEESLSLISSKATIPGQTLMDFNDGKTLILKQKIETDVIAEAKFIVSSDEVISAVHMSVRPGYRRYGISKLFGDFANRVFPNLARIETLLGLKNYDLFLELLATAPSLATDAQIRRAIMNTPAGKLAAGFGFNRLESYDLRNSDLAVVFTREQAPEGCHGLLEGDTTSSLMIRTSRNAENKNSWQ